jgi:hypothetical protein
VFGIGILELLRLPAILLEQPRDRLVLVLDEERTRLLMSTLVDRITFLSFPCPPLDLPGTHRWWARIFGGGLVLLGIYGKSSILYGLLKLLRVELLDVRVAAPQQRTDQHRSEHHQDDEVRKLVQSGHRPSRRT